MDAMSRVCVDREIQVAGDWCFPENRWREAILYFLFGMWAEKITRPKIMFGCVTLRLDPTGRKYFAYGASDEKVPEAILPDHRLLVADDRGEVELGLVQFVKNERIRRLTIMLYDGGKLDLWKTQRRGEYGCAADRIPRSWNGLGAAV